MNQVTHEGAQPFGLNDPGGTLQTASPPDDWVWVGLVLFGLSAVVWLVVLSRASLSFAYPFASLTYVMILLFDRFVLDESVRGMRWAGVALIIAGIVLVSRTPSHCLNRTRTDRDRARPAGPVAVVVVNYNSGDDVAHAARSALDAAGDATGRGRGRGQRARATAARDRGEAAVPGVRVIRDRRQPRVRRRPPTSACGPRARRWCSC